MNDGAVIVLCNRQSFNLGETKKKYLYLKRSETFSRCDRRERKKLENREQKGLENIRT